MTEVKDISILYVEDDAEVHQPVRGFLQAHFRHVYSAFNGKEGLELFQQMDPDVVLTDIRMPVMDGLEMAARIKEISPETPVIIISAFYESDLLMRAIDIGVDKYLRKPSEGEKLLEAIYKSVLPLIQKKEIENLNERLFISLENRISKSPVMQETIKRIQKVAGSDFSVLIHGETGVGKSYVARIIHDLSKRADKPFITVDIGTIPETLVESELFGHTRGAFTGADKNKKGFFEIAHGGTLFLEDLENISPYVQSKLLRAVEDKRFFSIGSTTPKNVDIRIIAATNKDIFAEVKTGQFREDLFYRLCEFDIHIPPLRERHEDISLLAYRFVQEVAAELGKTINEISPPALEALKKHPWKGNVRELKNIMRRSALFCDTHEISSQVITEVLETDQKARAPQVPPHSDAHDFSLANSVMQAEKEAIRLALQKTKGKKVNAASLLQIDYKTLMTKMKKYNLI